MSINRKAYFRYYIIHYNRQIGSLIVIIDHEILVAFTAVCAVARIPVVSVTRSLSHETALRYCS